MNIQSLTLENFGPYYGQHKIDFRTSREKPVILVGALNGGGKTTMLEAIKLVLFGKNASIARVGSKGYKAYLKSAINRKADESEGARLALEFTRVVEGKVETMRVVRSWNVGEKGVDERIKVEREGVVDPALSTERDWDLFVHGCLPQSLADLFFFEGDNIKKFAEEESSHSAKKILKEGVGFLFGTESVDRMIGDLDSFINKCLEVDESAEDVAARADLEVRHKVALEVLAEKQAVYEIKKDTSEARSKDYDATFKDFKLRGGEIFDNFSKYQDELKKAQDSLAYSTESLVAHCAGFTNLIPLLEQLSELRAGVDLDNKSQQAATAVSVIRERDEKLLDLLERLGIGGRSKEVAAWMEKDIKARAAVQSKAPGLGCPASLVAEIDGLFLTVFPSIRGDVKRALESHQQCVARHDGASRAVAQVPSEEYIRDVKLELDMASKAKTTADAALAAAEAELSVAKGVCVDLAGELSSLRNKLFERNQRTSDDQLMAEKASQAKSLLIKYKTQLLASRIGHIEMLIAECLGKLMRKKEQIVKVKISVPDFEICLFDASGGEVAYGLLSEGERQMLITSIVWGLARSSGKVFPLVVDTPLARLDSEHRGNLSREFYPAASHQSIIFSTDEEYIGPRLAEISPFVSSYYLLVNDGKSSSMILPKYFNQ